MSQLEAAYEAQRRAAEKAQQEVQASEKAFASADKALARYAERLEDILAAKQTIEELDKEK